MRGSLTSGKPRMSVQKQFKEDEATSANLYGPMVCWLCNKSIARLDLATLTIDDIEEDLHDSCGEFVIKHSN